MLLQPIALGALLIGSSKKRYLALYALFLCAFAAAWWGYLPNAKEDSRVALSTSVAPNGHLLWHWLAWPAYLVAAWLAFFVIGAFSAFDWDGRIFVLAAIGDRRSAIGVSLFAYYRSGTAGSMWCWVAKAASIYIIACSFAKMMKACKKSFV